jgi:hypothetical protein
VEPVFRSEVRRGEQVISAYEKSRRQQAAKEVVGHRLSEAGETSLERPQEAGDQRQADGGTASARGGSPEAHGGPEACRGGSLETCRGSA